MERYPQHQLWSRISRLTLVILIAACGIIPSVAGFNKKDPNLT
jgi:hypothetical protein